MQHGQQNPFFDERVENAEALHCLLPAVCRHKVVCALCCRCDGLDPSAAVVWVLAVGTAVSAALWAGHDAVQEAKCAVRSIGGDNKARALAYYNNL